MHTTVQQGKFDDTKCAIRIHKQKKAKTVQWPEEKGQKDKHNMANLTKN